MGVLKWYKRDPNAALHGMIGLTLEERGAYNSILDLIYAHDGAIEDNDKNIARQMGVDPRTWRRLRVRLLDLGKIYIHADAIRNRRADDDVSLALLRVGAAREAAAKKWAAYNEIKHLRDGSAMPTRSISRKSLSFLSDHRFK